MDFLLFCFFVCSSSPSIFFVLFSIFSFFCFLLGGWWLAGSLQGCCWLIEGRLVARWCGYVEGAGPKGSTHRLSCGWHRGRSRSRQADRDIGRERDVSLALLSGSLLLVLADVTQEWAAEDLAKQRRRARVLSRQSALLVLSGLAVVCVQWGFFL